MTRFKQNLALRAIFAIILSCVTVSLFAQSPAPSAEQDKAAIETESSRGFAQRTRIDWADFQSFDNGYESSVAIHPSGLIVEVHSSGQTIVTYTGLYYRIGKLDPVKGVTWGPSRRWVSPGTFGSWPAVAITKEGYAILTFSNAFTKKQCKPAVLRGHARSCRNHGPADRLQGAKCQVRQRLPQLRLSQLQRNHRRGARSRWRHRYLLSSRPSQRAWLRRLQHRVGYRIEWAEV